MWCINVRLAYVFFAPFLWPQREDWLREDFVSLWCEGWFRDWHEDFDDDEDRNWNEEEANKW